MRKMVLQEEGWVTEMQEVGSLVLWGREKREAWDLGGEAGAGSFPTLSHCYKATGMEM